MEGVGARLGRSSTRYGPATVFTGPVRKWKKKWIHVAPSTTASNNHSHSQRHTNPNNVTANATANSSTNASHLLLFKWTPITQSLNNGNADEKNAGKEDTPTVTEEPPRRKFKYMPVPAFFFHLNYLGLLNFEVLNALLQLCWSTLLGFLDLRV